jgi:hypothetical protein
MELVELGNTQHRERAIDVPESFVAVVKQSPRYPPPQPRTSLTRHEITGKRAIAAQQVDPYLHNMPPSPSQLTHQVAFSSPTHTFHSHTHHHNNNNSINTNANGSKMSFEADRLKRYSHELQRKRTEDELLRCSLRDSKKLQQLVHQQSSSNNNHLPSANGAFHEPQAIVNGAFESDELDFKSDRSSSQPSIAIVQQLPDALDRLMVQCQDQQFAQLVSDTSLDQLLRVYCNVMQQQSVHQQSPYELLHTLPNVSLGDLVQQTIATLQPRASTSNEAAELLNLLSKFELDGLCVAFDKIHHTRRVTAELDLQNQQNPLPTSQQSLMMSGDTFPASLHQQHMDGKIGCIKHELQGS